MYSWKLGCCVVELFDGCVKGNVLGGCWFWLRGLVKKAVAVMGLA